MTVSVRIVLKNAHEVSMTIPQEEWLHIYDCFKIIQSNPNAGLSEFLIFSDGCVVRSSELSAMYTVDC